VRSEVIGELDCAEVRFFFTDDLMMILNVVVAITCFVFTWCVVVLAIKGWARNRAVLEMAAKRGISGSSPVSA